MRCSINYHLHPFGLQLFRLIFEGERESYTVLETLQFAHRQHLQLTGNTSHIDSIKSTHRFPPIGGPHCSKPDSSSGCGGDCFVRCRRRSKPHILKQLFILNLLTCCSAASLATYSPLNRVADPAILLTFPLAVADKPWSKIDKGVHLQPVKRNLLLIPIPRSHPANPSVLVGIGD